MKRTGITIIELLLVLAIIGILSWLGVMFWRGAEDDAREVRTKAMIDRIEQMLNPRLEESTVRNVQRRLPPGTTPEQVRVLNQNARAKLMAFEFPCRTRFARVATFQAMQNPADPIPVPQLLRRYDAYLDSKADDQGNPVPHTAMNEGAELLYMILSMNFDESGNSMLHSIRKSEIGNTDVRIATEMGLTDPQDYFDLHPEIVDAWGDPLMFNLVDEYGAVILSNGYDDLENYHFEITSRNLK